MTNRLHFLPLVAVALAVLGSGPAAAQEEPGAISALVFHDLDGDGVRDDGEPGLPGQITFLSQGGELLRGIGGNFFGISLFSGLTPGDYTVTADIRGGGAGFCADGAGFLFDPFPFDFCAGVPLPWRDTTPDSVSVTVVSGETAEVFFGGQPLDVAGITGAALLEDGYAPSGTLIEALVRGQECGVTTATDSPSLNFTLIILGEGERAGCALPGDEVQFLVGGIPAAETIEWIPFIDARPPGFDVQHLTAMEEHAWYWAQESVPDLTVEGAIVQAVVDGVVCDETTLEVTDFAGGLAGFSRLIVPSESILPGCGRPGATTSFLVGGVEVGSVAWQPGLQRIDLGGAVGSPSLGTGPGEQGAATTTLIAGLLAAGLLLAGGSLLLARRR